MSNTDKEQERDMELRQEQQQDETEYHQSLIDEMDNDNLSCCGDEIETDSIDSICPTCGEHC